ncbi:hypothetical protein ACWGB8_21100 [Kitasatospora sp. NPDC054939]
MIQAQLELARIPAMTVLRDRLVEFSDPRHGVEHVFAQPVGGIVYVVFFVRTHCVEAAEVATRALCLKYLRAPDGAMIGRLLRCHPVSVAEMALRSLSGQDGAGGAAGERSGGRELP